MYNQNSNPFGPRQNGGGGNAPRDLFDVLDDVGEMINTAISSANFENLSKKISVKLNDTAQTVKREAERTKTVYADKINRRTTEVQLYPINKRAVRAGYGLPSKVFGIMFAFSCFSCVIASVAEKSYGMAAIFLALGAMFTKIAYNGIRASRLRRDFKRYINLMKDERYIQIPELAECMEKKEKQVYRDLSLLISMGAFPEGRLDKTAGMFFGSRAAYESYREYEAQKEEAEKRAESDPRYTELDAIIEKGMSYVSGIRQANDIILDEKISQNLDDMESILKKIFERLDGRPDLIPEVRKLMEYYLPTTEKLLLAYIELDSHNTDNTSTAKQEIEKSFEFINTAFFNLYNRLFYDEKVDIISDISALRQMFAQDNLNNTYEMRKDENK